MVKTMVGQYNYSLFRMEQRIHTDPTYTLVLPPVQHLTPTQIYSMQNIFSDHSVINNRKNSNGDIVP